MRRTNCAARRWRWLRGGSLLFALTAAGPAVAFADSATEPSPAPPPTSDTVTCPQACGQGAMPEAGGAASRENVPQAADQEYAQSRYQLGSDQQPDRYVPQHPYSQAHYQLGAGHQD